MMIPDVTPENTLEEKMKKAPVIEKIIALTDGHHQFHVNENPDVPKGRFVKFLYKKDGSLASPVEMKNLDEGERLITVYLPPGYSPERKPPYNLQITLDGDEATMRSLSIDVTLDNLVGAKKIEPVVTVFVPPWHGTPDFEKYPAKDEQLNQAPSGYSKMMRMNMVVMRMSQKIWQLHCLLFCNCKPRISHKI